MNKVLLLLAAAAAGRSGSCADGVAILSFCEQRVLTWTSSCASGVAVIQTATDVQEDCWTPAFYDIATNAVRTTAVPPPQASVGFYRVAIQTNAPDSSLVLHLAFDNDFSEGVLLDISGHGNHAIRYSVSNWPYRATGPDGSQAGQFWRYTPTSGTYAAVAHAPELNNLSNGTVLAWAHYTTNSYGASAIIDCGWYQNPYSWDLARSYSYDTRFTIVNTNGRAFYAVRYPDYSQSFETGGWHCYGATWNGINIVGYFDGVPISTNSQDGFPELVLGGRSHWIAVGCRHHDGTPEWGDDLYPNNGWMGGEIDDIRIYSRPLTALEIEDLYIRHRR